MLGGGHHGPVRKEDWPKESRHAMMAILMKQLQVTAFFGGSSINLWIVYFALFGIGFTSCNRHDPSVITVRRREPQRVGTCHVYIETIYDDNQPSDTKHRAAFMQTACDVPESALRGPQWWGEGLQPPGFSLDVGDCMPLDGVYYCLEDVVHMESAAFRPVYFVPEHPKGKLRKIR